MTPISLRTAGERRRPRTLAATLLGALAPLLAAMFLTAPPASAATLTEVTGFGANPSNLRMHLYVPDTVPQRPAVLVAVHYCTGTGPAFHAGTEFAALADRYGFIVIYPSATRSGQCFDVSSPQALRRDGGSDPVGIRSMVDYVQRTHGGDPERVYVTGASSGAMMTNVLLGGLPGRLRGRRGVRRSALRLLRHHRRLRLEQRLRAGADQPDAAGVGRHRTRRVPRVHRPPAAHADLARHTGRRPALPELR